MDCCCSIVPPQLLQGIADSPHNAEEVRARARAALMKHRRLVAERRRDSSEDPNGTEGPQPSGIVPRDLLRGIAESENVDEATRARARRDLNSLAALSTDNQEPDQAVLSAAAVKSPSRYVYDCRHSEDLNRAKLVRAEGQKEVIDQDGNAVNEAYENVGKVLKFYQDVFGWNSIDNKGMDIKNFVHYDELFENAFWSNQGFMAYGDGADFLYNFTGGLDVVAHEMSHGVTKHTSPLIYHGQSGALNEHLSDAFGVMCRLSGIVETATAIRFWRAAGLTFGTAIRQYIENLSTEEDDWLVGEDVLFPGVKGVALRSMKAPGTAYDDPRIHRKDEQPDHFKDYRVLPNDEDNDWGGVHLYSGIPNKAFYLVARAFGGNSWEVAGQIWWKARIGGQIGRNCTFQQFADITVECAKELGDDAAHAVREAWVEVGIERNV